MGKIDERYPENWKEISRRIRFDRAGGKCEQCSAPNGAWIVRSTINPYDYLVYDDNNVFYTPDGLRVDWVDNEYIIGAKFTRVWLTVHHIGVNYPDGRPGNPHDKMDIRDENLIALCQRCHLLADLDEHIKKRRYNRLLRIEQAIAATGQYRLFS